MPLIVAGKLVIKTDCRDQFIQQSLETISQARQNLDCEDFSVSADPIEPNRVNIFEKWQTRSGLIKFRESGADTNFFSLVTSFEVNEYEIDE